MADFYVELDVTRHLAVIVEAESMDEARRIATEQAKEPNSLALEHSCDVDVRGAIEIGAANA